MSNSCWLGKQGHHDPWWRSLLRLLFVVITYGKVSLWLWKRLEKSGNFFSYFIIYCGTSDCSRGSAMHRKWCIMYAVHTNCPRNWYYCRALVDSAFSFHVTVKWVSVVSAFRLSNSKLTMMGVDTNSLLRQTDGPSQFLWSSGQWPLSFVLHSSNKRLWWLYYDDVIINIVLVRAARTTAPLCFAAVSFFFIVRSPQSLGWSPQNFATWSELGAILKTRSKIWGSSPQKKFGAEKHAFLTRFWTTSHFDREYLPKGTRYRQSQNGVANFDLSRVCWHNLVWFTKARNRTVVCAYPARKCPVSDNTPPLLARCTCQSLRGWAESITPR